MRIFSEEFEYYVINLSSAKQEDFVRVNYDDKEYGTLEWGKEYYALMLNEMGALGWELITRFDDSWEEKGVKHTVDKLIFKRSSRSKYYKTGFGVNINDVSKEAKTRAEQQHFRP